MKKKEILDTYPKDSFTYRVAKELDKNGIFMQTHYIISESCGGNRFTLMDLDTKIIVYLPSLKYLTRELFKLDCMQGENGTFNLNYENFSDWIDVDHCAYKYVIGSDPENPDNRVAFIEKTPRVQILGSSFSPNKTLPRGENMSGWYYGSVSSGELCGKYSKSREWCDQMLQLLYG